MRQVLRRGFKEIIVDEVPDPALAPHHVLIRPVFSLISSGTETASIHQEGVVKGVAENPSHLVKVCEAIKSNGPVRTLAEVRAKFDEYAVLGYSGAGILVAKHHTVADLAVGDRVAYGGEGTGHAETILAGQNLVVRVPETVSLDLACFTTLGSIALNAVRTAAISIGDVVAVIGVGLVGQLISQLVKLQGGVVIAVDLKPERIQLAQRLGADYGVISGESLAAAVAALTKGRGADCVIVAAAARSPVPCQQAVRICSDRGRLVVVGAAEINLPWQEMYLKEIQLFMSRAYGPGSYDPVYEKHGQDYPISYVRWTERRNMDEFLRLVERDHVQLRPLTTHEFALEDAAAAYQTIMDPASNSLAVLFSYPADSGSSARDFRPRRKLDLTVRPTSTTRTPHLGVALVGAGNIARWAHLPVLAKLPGVTLKAVHSQSGARAKNYARRFGAAYCCSDYEEILNDPEVDLVVITTQNQHHALQATAALNAGKHVFLEKPMALTEDECWDLLRAVEDSGRQLTIGFNRRFAPLYRDLKRTLDGRSAPAVIHCRVNSPGISAGYWMTDPANGGAIVGEACHFIDLMYWLLQSEPIRVSAFSLPAQQKEPVGENNVAASFLFADGSIANLTYCTVGSRTSGGERVEVYTAGVGALVEDFKRLRVNTVLRRSKSRWWPEKGYRAQMESFVTCLRDGRKPEVTVDDGARATIACLRTLESVRTATPRAIDLPSAGARRTE